MLISISHKTWIVVSVQIIWFNTVWLLLILVYSLYSISFFIYTTIFAILENFHWIVLQYSGVLLEYWFFSVLRSIEIFSTPVQYSKYSRVLPNTRVPRAGVVLYSYSTPKHPVLRYSTRVPKSQYFTQHCFYVSKWFHRGKLLLWWSYRKARAFNKHL